MDNKESPTKQPMSIPGSPAIAFLDGPVPGSSLTTSLGSRPYEQPPKYVKEEDALYGLLDSLTDPKKGVAVGKLLSKGVYASDIANTVLVGGTSTGKWTPDLAALMAKKVLGMVVAVGHAQGVKDMKYMKPSPDEDILDTIDSLPSFNNKSPKR